MIHAQLAIYLAFRNENNIKSLLDVSYQSLHDILELSVLIGQVSLPREQRLHFGSVFAGRSLRLLGSH